MNDDVNDAAWILIHAIDDMCRKHVEQETGRVFTQAERRRMYEDARLFCQVFNRYEVNADV